MLNIYNKFVTIMYTHEKGGIIMKLIRTNQLVYVDSSGYCYGGNYIIDGSMCGWYAITLAKQLTDGYCKVISAVQVESVDGSIDTVKRVMAVYSANIIPFQVCSINSNNPLKMYLANGPFESDIVDTNSISYIVKVSGADNYIPVRSNFDVTMTEKLDYSEIANYFMSLMNSSNLTPFTDGMIKIIDQDEDFCRIHDTTEPLFNNGWCIMGHADRLTYSSYKLLYIPIPTNCRIVGLQCTIRQGDNIDGSAEWLPILYEMMTK